MTLGRTCSHFIRHVEVEYHSKDDCTFPTECVCLFVCLRAYLKNHMAKIRFQCMSTGTMVRPSSKYSSSVARIRAKSAIYNCLVTILPFCPLLCPLYVRILARPVHTALSLSLFPSALWSSNPFWNINVGNEGGVVQFCGFAYLSPNWLPRQHLLSIRKRLHFHMYPHV